MNNNTDKGLQGNEKIEEAIAGLQKETTQEMLAHALTVIRRSKSGKYSQNTLYQYHTHLVKINKKESARPLHLPVLQTVPLLLFVSHRGTLLKSGKLPAKAS